MNKIATVIMALSLCLSASASVIIRGTIDPESGSKISLYAITQNFDSLCATGQADANGRFVLKPTLPYNGFYVLANESGLKHGIYLKDGKQLTVKYSNERLEVTGGLSAEEKNFASWAAKSAQTFLHAYLFNYIPGGKTVDPAKFAQEMKTLKQTASGLKQLLKGKGQKADLLSLKIDADLAFFMLAYRKNHIGDVDENFISKADLQAYDQLFRKTAILQLPYAPEMLASYIDYKAEKQAIKPENYLQRAELLSDQPLREAYLYQIARQLRYYEKYTALRQSLGELPLSTALQNALKPIEEQLAWSKPGQTAIDFKGVRPDGSTLSLSDLHGKVVVVDVWATWCAPCIRMIPHFKRLEQELSHPDLTFLSVCIGVWVETDRWKKLIQQHQLSGNLIFIDSWTKGFAPDYHVTGVPRFMIIDREGRMVSFAAPAPTHPELKEMILNALK